MRNGFEILVWAIFPQMYLWIHDKYSSIRFKQCEWQRKILQHCWLKIAKWSHGPVVKGRTFFAGGSWNAGSNPSVASSSSFIVFLPLGFLLFILTADPVSFARFLRKRISSILTKTLGSLSVLNTFSVASFSSSSCAFSLSIYSWLNVSFLRATILTLCLFFRWMKSFSFRFIRFMFRPNNPKSFSFFSGAPRAREARAWTEPHS